MTDYKLVCDCGHDASEHVDVGCTRCGCAEPSASLYAAECARISGHLAKLQEAHAIVWAERDAARAECDRYKAALELILKIDSYTAGAKDIARTALDGENNANR